MKIMAVSQKSIKEFQLLPGYPSGMKGEVDVRDMTTAGFILLIIVSLADKFCRILRFWQDLIGNVLAGKNIVPLFYGGLILI